MDWKDVLNVPLEKDLSAFARFLSVQGIQHRIIECGGRQVLRSNSDPEAIRRWFNLWEAGRLETPLPSKAKAYSYAKSLKGLLRYPIVLITAMLAVAVYLVSQNDHALMSWFVFQDTRIDEHGFLHTLASTDGITAGQWWRLLTPIFLHFGLLHLVFNGLWLIEFGRRIERLQSHARLIVVIASSGIISNLCQYAYEPSILFGGLSGVVYGLFAYCWLWGYWESRSVSGNESGIAPPPGIAPFLLFWLFLCMSGVLSLVGIYVANAAHIGGLLSGFLTALIYRIKARGFSSVFANKI